MMLRLFLFAAATVIGMLSPVGSSLVFAGLPLSDAIHTGKVEVSITGRGSSSGDAINLHIQRRVPDTLQIDIQPGTVLRSKSGKAQSMVFRSIRFEKVVGGWKKTNEILLNDDRRRMFVLEAYCRDMTRPTPKETDQFAVESVNKKESQILARGVEVNASNKVVQAAIWIDRDKANAEQLQRRLDVSADEFRVATHLATAAVDVDVSTSKNRTDVDVELKEITQLVARLRAKRETARAAAPLQRGDKARVNRRDAKLTIAKSGGHVIARLPKGHRVDVIRVAGDDVVTLTVVDGRRYRGWLKVSALRLTEKATKNPRGLLGDTALQVLNKVQVRAGATPSR